MAHDPHQAARLNRNSQNATQPDTGAVTAVPHRKSWWPAFGPGLVFALTVIGPSDIISNAAAGADYGYSLLWALVIALLFRYVWVTTSAKYVLVTGETLLQGYARLGKWVVWLMLGSLLVYRHAGNLALIVVIGSAANLALPLPGARGSSLWALIFVAVAFAIMYWGRYRTVEVLFKGIAAILSVTFGAAAVLSRPDLPAAAKAILMPSLPANTGFHDVLFVLMALIGAGSGSLTNLTYSYFLHRSGWRGLEQLKRQRIDLLMSIIFMFILSSCVQLAAAGTLQPGAPLNTVDDLAGMLARTGGRLGVFIFATGLWAGALSVFIGASTGFALIVNDIGRNILSFGGKDRPGSRGNSNPEQDPLYRGAILFAVVSPLYILLTGVRPVWLVLFVTSLTLVLVPITAVGLLWITNDRARLGKHANGWITNLVLVILIATSILMAVSVWFNLHR